MAKVTLKINGMSCGHCVSVITKALEEVPGVEGTRVSLRQNQAAVDYDPAAVSPAAISKAVTDLGYEVTGSE